MVAHHSDDLVQITEATASDVLGIQNVMQASWQSVYADLLSEEHIARTLRRSFSEAALARSVNHAGATYLVAWVDGEIRGMCHYGSPLLDDCENRKALYSVYVHPDWWQQGIGTALLDVMEAHLRPQRVTDVFTYVDARNTLASTFFTRHGFVHLPDDDRDGELYLRKVL